MAHRDPAHRALSFHVAHAQTTPRAQARRRSAALVAQAASRQHAFMAARSGAVDPIDAMGDLTLASSSADDDDDAQFADADADADAARVDPKASKGKRVYRPWAKNLLMYAETLDLALGLPDRLEEQWMGCVVPKGKRCLASSTYSEQGANTSLLSRVSGRTLECRRTSLPPECLLDCIWDDQSGVLWVLDLVRWRGTWFVECEAQMRAFFLLSKLSELPAQPYSPTTFLVLPTPSLAPLSSKVLLSLLDSLTPTTLTPSVLLPTPTGLPAPSTIPITFAPTGLLLYLKNAHYESGTTVLSAWVPLEVEAGREGREGVARLRELVEQWIARGGSSGDAIEDDESEGARLVEMQL